MKMPTQKMSLNATPQRINVGENGVRVQSRGGTPFLWCERGTLPTGDALQAAHSDRDIAIGYATTIYVWSEHGVFDVVVTGAT